MKNNFKAFIDKIMYEEDEDEILVEDKLEDLDFRQEKFEVKPATKASDLIYNKSSPFIDLNIEKKDALKTNLENKAINKSEQYVRQQIISPYYGTEKYDKRQQDVNKQITPKEHVNHFGTVLSPIHGNNIPKSTNKSLDVDFDEILEQQSKNIDNSLDREIDLQQLQDIFRNTQEVSRKEIEQQFEVEQKQARQTEEISLFDIFENK